jgi:hypothetical protein
MAESPSPQMSPLLPNVSSPENRLCKINAQDEKHIFEPKDGGKLWSLDDIIENFGKKGLLCSKTIDKRKQCLRFRIDLDALASHDPHFQEIMQQRQQQSPPQQQEPSFMPEHDFNSPPPIMPAAPLTPSPMAPTPASDFSVAKPETPHPLESSSPLPSAPDMLEEGPKPRLEDEDEKEDAFKPEPVADAKPVADAEPEAVAPDADDDEFGEKKDDKPKVGGNEPDPACVQKCLLPASPAPHLPGTASTNTTHDLASSMKIFLVHKEIDKDERTLWTRLTSSSSPSGGGTASSNKKKKNKRLTRRPAKKQQGKRRPKTLRQRRQ